ncbi:MAG TPA: Xaa-Pro peptidase family protein, partial [Anaerolineales bacterium]
MAAPDARPTIPAQEYPQRWDKVQKLMDQRGLDFLIAYADDRAVFGPAHARWLANFPVHFEPVCILIARGEEPLMLCGPESDEYARLAGRIPQVRVLHEFTHPDEDYPYAQIQSLSEIVADLIPHTHGRLKAGLAGLGLMSAHTWAAFQEALPQTEWVDVENALCDLRAEKTPAEIAVIRYAYRIAETGLTAGIAALQAGVTERDVAAEIEAAMRRFGAEGTGIDTIVASGPNTRPILARSTFREVGADELVLLTVAPRYEGYHAAIGRPVLVGDPGDEIRQAAQVAVMAQESCYQALRAGIEGREVEALGRRIVEAAGLGRYFLYSGIHSVGVIEFEPPIFGPSSPTKLRKDMVISVDIPLFNTPWGGLRVEDGYLIADNGAQ